MGLRSSKSSMLGSNPLPVKSPDGGCIDVVDAILEYLDWRNYFLSSKTKSYSSSPVAGQHRKCHLSIHWSNGMCSSRSFVFFKMNLNQKSGKTAEVIKMIG